jgi:hypothetical protein
MKCHALSAYTDVASLEQIRTTALTNHERWIIQEPEAIPKKKEH